MPVTPVAQQHLDSSGNAAVPGDANQLLRVASRLARFGGWSIDLAEGQIRWSDEVAAIHDMPAGYSPALQEGINFYAPEWRPLITELFSACVTHGKSYDAELEIVSARGNRIWVRSVGDAVRDETGVIVGVQGAFQDISERKRVELELAASESRYRMLFESMTAGFLLLEVVDNEHGVPVDLILLAGNREFERSTGLRMAEVTGMRLTQALPGIQNDAADWIGRYGRVAQTGDPAQFEQHSELLDVDYLVSAFQSGAKRCAVTFVDISLRRQAERAVHELHEELRQHADMLEQRVAERTAELEAAKVRAEAADRAKSTFLATMSHELRTPLNSIIGFTELLLQLAPGPLNAEQEKQLGIVQQSARHLLSLITDVLDLAKIEAGQLKLDPKSFDLRHAIERISPAFRTEANRRGLQFTLDLDSFDASVLADERCVAQILNNLLSNALKFTPQGAIGISLARGESDCTVTVTDTGVGIAAHDIDRLFRRFSQVDSGLPDTREGTGLGLAISRHLVEALGGVIWVESSPGSGSRFSFTLPLGSRCHDADASPADG